ncbi:MAG TPA: ATP-binding cassette domain-containing protein, partial [Cytophagales bacterium]|nr:ATP-binding cassette domain-containing protein [Cytophagales bacterium]
MSEEILKALMQLFAIILKQDEAVSNDEKLFVERFLKQQLNPEMVAEYYALFESFLSEGAQEPGGEEKKKKLTSVKDSVKTLSICKKINKTLTQKQKIIVLIRLFELIGQRGESEGGSRRKEIVHTVSDVFNINQTEFNDIENFCQEEDFRKLLPYPNFLLVGENLEKDADGAKVIPNDIDQPIALLRVASEDMYFLRYSGHNTLSLNGLPVNRTQISLFAYGSTLKLPHGEPIYYSDIHAQFLSGQDIPKLAFEATKLGYKFPNGAVGLQDINISEGAGKLIAIMGGSGAGKTTLLNVLAGLESPSEGSITVNGIDINKEKEKIEGIIGYVAQDDILFEELTVFQNLYYNAKLCFKDYNEEELEKAVIKTLKSLGLYEIKDIKVGNVLNKKISGGQRKRLNIALELIREPVILFLDEPTSGLSSRDSENVIDLLKELTLKGKLIFVVIHQPSSDIYKMFDKVVILDVGGFQIYYGNPVHAVTYFKKLSNQINADEGQCSHCGNVNPEQVFNTIDAKVVDEYGNLTETRKVSPKLWHNYFNTNIKPEKTEKIQDLPPKALNRPSRMSQFMVFVKRDILSKISNTQYMLINLLEAPLLGLLLSFIIRYVEDPKGHYHYEQNENIPAYIFMAIIVALFMGLTVSAEEIIRDAKILKRESFLNLSRFSYLSSKVVILFLLSAIQTVS